MPTLYGDSEGFTAYHTARGRTIPDTWDDTVINASLLVAAEWLDGVYGSSYSGFKTGGFLQEREWPRTTALTNTYPQYIFQPSEMPDRVISAAYEAAFRDASTPGSLQVDYTPGKYKSVAIDGALTVDYTQFSSQSDIQIQIGAIDMLLWPLFTTDGAANSATLSGGAKRV